MSAGTTSTPASDGEGLATSYAPTEEGSLLHAGALLFFDGPVEHTELLAAVERAARAIPALRTRPARVPLAADVLGWSPDPGFRASRHVRVVEVDGADERTLAHAAAALWSSPLRHDRPPWQLELLADREGRGVAVLLKAHPALLGKDGADGATLAAALLGGSTLPDAPPAPPDATARRPAGLLPELLHVASAVAERGARGSRALAAEVRSLLRPGVALARTREVGRMLESAGTLLSSPAPETPWNAILGNERTLAWLSLPLDALRGVAEGFGGEWQDAWLTIVADALGRVLRERGRPTTDLTLLAFVPLPDADGRTALLGLPVGEMEPAARFSAVRGARRDPAATASGAGLAQIAAVAQRLPEPLQSLLGSLCFQAANALVAFDRTPDRELHVGERRVTSLVPFAGLPWQVGLALATLAGHDDELTIGVTADPSLVPSVAGVVEALRDAYAELAMAAGVPPVGVARRLRASR